MIRGYLESVGNRSAIGWALDDGAPGAPLMVRLLLGGQVLAQSSMTMFRPDLRQWGGGGVHGFSAEFALPLMDGELAAVTAEAARAGGAAWHPLQRLPGESAPPAGTLAAAGRLGREFAGAAWSEDPARPPLAAEDCFPVFVTGSVRTATSALTWALMRATRYKGFAEGHVIDLAAALSAAVRVHLEEKHRFLPAEAVTEFHLYHFPAARLEAAVQQLLRRLAAGFATPFWIDKTPSHEMLLSVPLVARAWPNGRFVFMRRRGVENVMSRLRKFPTARFEPSCRRWAQIMAEWRRVRATIPDRWVEIEQRDLLTDPDGTAGRVGALLGLPAIETAALAAELRVQRPEVTDPAARVVADLSETGWTAEMIETFGRICGPEMAEYGYTYDSRYRE